MLYAIANNASNCSCDETVKATKAIMLHAQLRLQTAI